MFPGVRKKVSVILNKPGMQYSRLVKAGFAWHVGKIEVHYLPSYGQKLNLDER